jgi:hypothetical protein
MGLSGASPLRGEELQSQASCQRRPGDHKQMGSLVYMRGKTRDARGCHHKQPIKTSTNHKQQQISCARTEATAVSGRCCCWW